MINNVKIDGDILEVNGVSISFNYSIRDTKVIDEDIIVLLKIPYNDTQIDNIYCVDNYGCIKWQVESLSILYPNQNNLPYEQMNYNGKDLTATDFYGRKYYINIADGKIEKREIVK